MDGFSGKRGHRQKIREIYSPETTAIIVIPPLIAQKGSRMETFRNCLLQHDFGENVHVLPLHFFLPGKTPAFILGTASISTPWDMKPFRLRFSASSNSF